LVAQGAAAELVPSAVEAAVAWDVAEEVEAAAGVEDKRAINEERNK
jgi:hypothetical protein